MKLAVERTVEQQIDDALFPRSDVEGPMLAVEVVVQSKRRAKDKLLATQCGVKLVEAAQSTAGEIIERFAVGGRTERLSPLKQRLGVHAHCGAIEFSLGVHITPA